MHRILFFVLVCLCVFAQNPAVTVQVNVNANRHIINPMIYGVAYGDATTLADLNAPLNRLGGNNTSRYNWQINADNRGQDWYFESVPANSAVAGEVGDTFVSVSKGAGAQPMITIPMIGWVGKLGANRGKLASFSIAKYGAQTGADYQWFPDAGNGIRTNGQFVTGNDPNDANVAAGSVYQQQWVNHLVSRWGTAANGGVRYYILDNEHSIWHSTHRDVHPTGATGVEIRDKMLDYAARIRAADPSALIAGPEEWGWSGYVLSGYDQQYGSLHGWSYMPDRSTSLGGMDYLPWLLSQWKSMGQRPVDVFTVHYYPQGGEFSNDTSSTMQARRNRSTRSLWDPNYTDETWIADKVRLVPRLKQWVQSYYYAGTPVGITEYNWGAEGHINGATTQADIYGIFGREGLDMAARWTTPSSTTPAYKAMKMYRNYDGAKAGFGDTSVSAVAPNPDTLSAFAAVRSGDGALTVMVINKVAGATPVTLSLAGFAGTGSAQAWQLTSSNAITRVADVAYSGTILNATVPGQSVTLFVLPASGGNQPPVAAITATPVSGVAPLVVSFNGSGSTDSDGSISNYAWSFGDGSNGTGATVSHSYAAAGTYAAALTVTDNQGATGTATALITVTSAANQPPVAAFTVSPVTGTAPLAVSFNGSGSSDPDGSIASYAWNFGDGSTGTGVAVAHTYTAAGTFTATLTVTDNRGATNSIAKTINVFNGSASCRVTYSITNDWGNGFQAAVTLVNTGSPINGWTLTWSFAGNQKIYELWNGRVQQKGKNVTVRNATYNANLATGATVPIGFNATYSGANAKPTAFSLNGKPCQVSD